MRTLVRMTTVAPLLCFFSTVWPAVVQAKPLPNDERILQGKLDNGVTWMFRKHDNPPGKMALIMRVNTGSLNETDHQKGLAHFIEHMCFNGTKNFPPGKLIPFFESIGMEFGADLNAFTSFDQTAYMLFLPTTDREQIDKGLLVLSDYVFRAMLTKEEIDKERGVVLEESRTGKNAFQRIRDKLWPELFEGARFAERLPIGKEDILKTAQRDQFVDYYRTWYRPENVTVVAVGDVDAEKVIPLIKKQFGAYHPTVTARKEKGAEFKTFTKQRSIVVTDPEMAFCQVQMLNILPGRPPATTVKQWRRNMIESIGNWIVGRRYEELVNKGKASFRSADTGTDDFFHDAVLVTGEATGEPADWPKMLDELVTEISRARQFGFSERELELAKKEMLADAEHAVKTEPTQNARSLLFKIVFAVNDMTPVLSAQQELDLYRELLPTAILSEVAGTFEKHFTPGNFAYVVTMGDEKGITVPSRDEVLAAVRAAWAKKVEPLEKKSAPSKLLASSPTPGKVVGGTKEDALNLKVTSAWLANGVRMHHRFMDYKKDSVMVSITLAGGEIEEAAKNRGVTDVASLAINEAATHHLTSTNIRDIMTGKNINVRGGGNGDSFVISVTGSPEDLEIGLQEVYALLTDGKVEESAFKNWKLSTIQQINMIEKMPRIRGFLAMEELLSGGDPRRVFLKKENVEALSAQQGQTWFDRLCREAPIEVAVVGDIKLEPALRLVEKYIGSLPSRRRGASHLDKLRALARSTGPLVRRVEVDTVTPQATAFAGFVGCEGRKSGDRRALRIAANILSSKLVKRVREDLSIVYSIRAVSIPSWMYRDSGRFFAGAPCDPKNADQVVEEVHKLFQAFADNGPSAEEMENAQKQIANDLDTEMREPRYWWGLLRGYDLHGRSLEQAKKEKEAFAELTAEQIQKVFRKYYVPTRQFSLTAIPVHEKKPEGASKK